MAIKVIYTCDRCGHQQETPEQMWNANVAIWAVNAGPPNLMYDSLNRKRLWCRDCCEQLHMLPAPKEKPIETPPPSLEDLIREIVRDERAMNPRDMG